MNKKARLHILMGLASGIVLPLLTIALIHTVRFDHLTFIEFAGRLFSLKIAGKFISLAAIPNLMLFFVFIWTNRLYAARGAVIATFLLALFILLLKFL
jgi:hypothetical protein